MSRGLRRGRFGRPRNSEEINPLDGTLNIVDAMLVFACGMMLSLIVHWNVDLGQAGLAGTRVELNSEQEVSQAPEIQDLIETKGQGQLYEELGKVYKDPATGKLFMLTK